MTEPARAAVSDEARPWGVWATIGLSLAVAVVYVIASVLAVLVYAMIAAAKDPDFSFSALAQPVDKINGLLLSVVVCLTSVFCTAMTIWFAWLCRRLPVRSYLALNSVRAAVAVRWLMVAVVFAVGSDTLTHLLGRGVVPEFMVYAYATAESLVLLCIAVIVVAPFFEEVFFRGFLLRGLAHSKLGSVGAVLLTSLFWAVIHVQYDVYGMSTIFVLGLIIGWARVRTNSIYMAFVMHATINAIATLQVAVYQ